MKKKSALISAVAILGIFLTSFNSKNQPDKSGKSFSKEDYDTLRYEALWTKADQLLGKGLPKSAAEVVDEVYKMAREENNSPMYIKAVIYKMKVVSDYEENFLKKMITDLKEEIRIAKFPDQAILHSMLASTYLDYYRQNRHKFFDRSQMASNDDKDIESWDLNKIMQKIIVHFQASIQASDQLKEIPIDDFLAILIEEENSEVFRPTLYDFLAHRAVDFYMNDENSLTQPAFVFRLDDEKYFKAAKAFVDLKIESRDTSSLKYHAILILQDLIAFHLNDKDPSALVDVDLKRLAFVHQNNYGITDPDMTYLEALQELRAAYPAHPVSTRVIYEMSTQYERLGNQFDPYDAPQYQWELKKAYDLCREAIQKFPNSLGAKNCKAVLSRIENTSLMLETAQVELPGEPILASLSYRNTKKIKLRFVKTNYMAYRQLQRNRNFAKITGAYEDYQTYKSLMLDLPDQGDFQEHNAQIALPELEPGFYVILLSSSEALKKNESPDGIATLMVSQMSYISSRKDNGDHEFFVLDRKSGKALKRSVFRFINRNIIISGVNTSIINWNLMKVIKTVMSM